MGIGGAILNALAKRCGFWLWIVGNGLWIIVGIKLENYGMIAQFSVFFILAVIGLRIWKKKKI